MDFNAFVEYYQTRTGQAVVGLVGVGLFWLVLFLAKRLFARRLSSRGFQIFRDIALPLNFGLLVLAISFVSQFLPKETARHPFMRYGVRVGFLIAGAWIVERLVSYAIRRSRLSSVSGPYGEGRDLVVTLSRLAVLSIAALILFDTLGISVTPILASLGVGSVAVALALQDTLGNFFAGVYLLADSPIRVGDFIKMENGPEGQVIRIGWRMTELLQTDERYVVVPNSKLATAIVTNLSRPEPGFIVRVDVPLEYGSEPRVTTRLLGEIGRECQDKLFVGKPLNPPTVRIQNFGGTGLQAAVFVQAPSFSHSFELKHELVLQIHARFKAEGIKIPVPNVVVQN